MNIAEAYFRRRQMKKDLERRLRAQQSSLREAVRSEIQMLNQEQAEKAHQAQLVKQRHKDDLLVSSTGALYDHQQATLLVAKDRSTLAAHAFKALIVEPSISDTKQLSEGMQTLLRTYGYKRQNVLEILYMRDSLPLSRIFMSNPDSADVYQSVMLGLTDGLLEAMMCTGAMLSDQTPFWRPQHTHQDQLFFEACLYLYDLLKLGSSMERCEGVQHENQRMGYALQANVDPAHLEQHDADLAKAYSELTAYMMSESPFECGQTVSWLQRAMPLTFVLLVGGVYFGYSLRPLFEHFAKSLTANDGVSKTALRNHLLLDGLNVAPYKETVEAFFTRYHAQFVNQA